MEVSIIYNIKIRLYYVTFNLDEVNFPTFDVLYTKSVNGCS